jgi:hypothetical protein
VPSLPAALLAALLALGGAALAQDLSAPSPRPEAPAAEAARSPDAAASPDPRSRELYVLECATDQGRREVTLFANGTVRLRQGPMGREAMALGEMSAEEVAGIVAQLSALDLADGGADESGLVGPTVERCTVTLRLPGKEPVERRFGRFDTQTPELARLVAAGDGLSERAQRNGPPTVGPGLPAGYQAKSGDVLERADGARFEVVTDTADGRGVELRGVEQPLTLYVGKGQLAQEFVRLVREGRR